MIPAQNAKNAVALAPISINSGAATTTTVDTLGFSYAVVNVNFGVIGGAATVFKLTECDTSGGSYTDITGAVGSGSTGNTRLPQTGDAGKVIKFFVPLGGSRLRFIKPEITTGATTIVGINVDLYRGNEAPSSLTERGIAAQIFV